MLLGPVRRDRAGPSGQAGSGEPTCVLVMGRHHPLRSRARDPPKGEGRRGREGLWIQLFSPHTVIVTHLPLFANSPAVVAFFFFLFNDLFFFFF